MTGNPSSKRLVVSTRSPEDLLRLADRLEGIATLQQLEPHGNLALVEIKDDLGQPRTAWERLSKAAGGEVAVDPVLVDEEGAEHYPTGSVAVRFQQEPSDEDLDRFGAEHGLRVRSRNKYVPSQVEFEPLERATNFLPEVVDRLRKRKNVRTAWATTLSRYKRL